jgi:predicted glycogen debranching enzyme
MSTVPLLHTRRYHGALVAELDPPLGRHVIISHAETTVHVEADKRTYRLATHQFPNVAPTLGYRLIEYFAMDPIPRWMFRLGQHTLERTLCLARGRNAVVLSYTWYGKTPCSISVRPLMPLRPATALMTEHGGMRQVVTLRPGAVELRPVAALPPIHFAHQGVFMGSPDWWRRFEYLGDRADGLPFHEDMWTPGVFEMVLEPGRTAHLVTAVGKLPEREPSVIVAETRDFVRSQDFAGKRSPVVRVLGIAAEQFLVECGDESRVLAGYPWLAVHTRDIVMALPGLLLVVRSLIRHLHGGLLPERLDPGGGRRARSLPDATLWLFEVARLLMPLLGAREAFVQHELYPALVRAFARLRGRRRLARDERTRRRAHVDGLSHRRRPGDAAGGHRGRAPGPLHARVRHARQSGKSLRR